MHNRSERCGQLLQQCTQHERLCPFFRLLEDHCQGPACEPASGAFEQCDEPVRAQERLRWAHATLAAVGRRHQLRLCRLSPVFARGWEHQRRQQRHDPTRRWQLPRSPSQGACLRLNEAVGVASLLHRLAGQHGLAPKFSCGRGLSRSGLLPNRLLPGATSRPTPSQPAWSALLHGALLPHRGCSV